ncbi:MAG: ATP-dependent zinc metalloprotease FtsH [Patescibacteria group bacterium]
MQKNDNPWEKLKKFFTEDNKEDKKKDKNNVVDDLPKEVRDKLPSNMKVKRVKIGPGSILRGLVYVILAFWLFSSIRQMFTPNNMVEAPLSTVVETIKNNEAEKVIVMDNEILVELKDGDQVLMASKEPGSSMTEILQREGIDIGSIDYEVENRQGWKTFGDILSLLLTVGLPLLFIVWFLGKQTGGGSGGIFGFGKSTAKLFVKGKQDVTFKDVAGVSEAKRDLEEIVDFLKHPEKYKKVGARAPKGVLLVGPAGVGKTLLAKAVAGEADVPFYSMAGSEFMEMLVGVGASRVRDLFGTAKKAGKAIIFIDEIDAIGRMRGGLDGGHGEREQTLNQILVEMDGFEPNTAVVVLAATNRGDLLDPALMRPGRFDRRVILEMPDIEARKEIIDIHAEGKPFDEMVNWEAVARRTVGFSGADLENMLNEAAIGAARNNRIKINMGDIEDAALKVKLGAEKRRQQSEEDRKMTAYHEAGHAIVNYVEDLDPVHRVSIVSRGMALGYTLVPPKQDRVHETKQRLIKQMAMAMGGRAAEELEFEDITTGAASDISHATRIARDMVIEWGMSELGPINMGPQIDINDFGKAYMEPAKISDLMMAKVDDEINKLVNTALNRARTILKENKEKLDRIARVLVEKESLDESEFEELMKGNKA